MALDVAHKACRNSDVGCCTDAPPCINNRGNANIVGNHGISAVLDSAEHIEEEVLAKWRVVREPPIVAHVDQELCTMAYRTSDVGRIEVLAADVHTGDTHGRG